MNNIFLKTDRLILRRLEESDFPDYAAYAVDDEMSRMMGRPILKTEADIRINFNWLKDMEPRCYGIMEKSRQVTRSDWEHRPLLHRVLGGLLRPFAMWM